MGFRVLGLAAICLVVLVAPGSAAASDQVIASVSQETELDAYAGRLVWNEPSPDGYRLVDYSAGRGSRLPIAPRAYPFDVDLGPDRKGGTVAVYSRCKRSPTPSSEPGRDGCDLYRYDFESGTESPITRVNSRFDERFPTIWKSRIVFTRIYPPKRARGRGLVYRSRMYWRPIGVRGRTRRLHRPPLVDEVDMRGTRVALSWSGECGEGGEVRVARTSGATSVLTRFPGGCAAPDPSFSVFGVSIASGFVYWILRGSDLTELRRYDLSRRREERARLAVSLWTSGFAQDEGVAYLVAPRNDAGCGFPPGCLGPYDIHRIEGLEFEPAPPIPRL